MASSNGHIFRVNGPLWGEVTVDRWIPLTKASDVELWCFLWFAPWINNRKAGDLRLHRADYDVIVMNELRPVAHKQQFCYLYNQSPIRYMHTCLPVTVGNWRPGEGWLKMTSNYCHPQQENQLCIQNYWCYIKYSNRKPCIFMFTCISNFMLRG